MDTTDRPLQWSAQYELTSSTFASSTSLPGDKILLPPAALEQLLAQTQQLPQPLTFRLVNPVNGRLAYAGVREFSAEDGQAALSQFLAHALGIDGVDSNDKFDNGHFERPRVTIHAKQLPKGTYVKIRPLDAGYDPEDWKSLLEEHLRKNFTTLTKGEILHVPVGQIASSGTLQQFRFLIDEFAPAGDGICVVDTDLEVNIEALNEDQALETLKIIAAKRQLDSLSTQQGNSAGGELGLNKQLAGHVLPGEYIDYQVPHGTDLVRSKPRDDEHVLGDFDCRPSKRLRLTQADLEGADAILVSVHAPPELASTASTSYSISVMPESPALERSVPSTADHVEESKCSNCGQYVPKQSLVLHENFCLRNNVLCPHGCGRVFQKRSPAYQHHWHCPHDLSSGDTPSSKARHDEVFHRTYYCPLGPHEVIETFPSLPALAAHRTTNCPEKPINCRFCHLTVPQGEKTGVEAEVFMSGLTPHELADGGRTNDCYICGRMVRMREMESHLKNHDFERTLKAEPRICRNLNCGNTLKKCDNDIQICNACFGPLYNSAYDPDGKALARRVERRYLTQLTRGCAKRWCRNEYCKDGRQHLDPLAKTLTMKEALPMAQQFMQRLKDSTDLHFCVDEACQSRRQTANLLQAEARTNPMMKEYAYGWYVAALEASQDLDSARSWLSKTAPSLYEQKNSQLQTSSHLMNQ